MRDIEIKLRHGMEHNGITGPVQDAIIQSITSFALYGFPESHAASFALIAYASAYLKCHYLAAFTAAMLNNQPMGCYHPSTLVKDAQRHGLKLRPIDITTSEYECTVETAPTQRHRETEEETFKDFVPVTGGERFVVRLGLNYVRGLRGEVAKAIVAERERQAFASIADLVRRVPGLRKNELVMLADVGALNAIGSSGERGMKLHRRDALWQVERAARPAGPLLEGVHELDQRSPLEQMTNEERLVADFRRTGLTVGPHPMAYQRGEMNRRGIHPAVELPKLPNGVHVKTAGCVIARQRPGTAHGFVFLSLEDETGIANAIVTPDLFQQHRLLLVSERFLVVEGKLQNIDNVVSVKADRVSALEISAAETSSHDFH